MPGGVLVVGPHQERFLSPFQLAPPLLQCQFHHEQLPFANVVFVLGRGKAAREEGTGLKILVGGGTLQENTSHAKIGASPTPRIAG